MYLILASFVRKPKSVESWFELTLRLAMGLLASDTFDSGPVNSCARSKFRAQTTVSYVRQRAVDPSRQSFGAGSY